MTERRRRTPLDLSYPLLSVHSLPQYEINVSPTYREGDRLKVTVSA